jgi:predicted nucleic-acid-binding protein
VIGIDTNLIVRLLVVDDERQSQAATRFLQAHCSSDDPGLVSDIVLVETTWVLQDLYGYSRSEIAAAVDGLIATAQLRTDAGSEVHQALHRYRNSGADFADCLLGANNVRSGCEYTATFDRKASRLPEFKLVSH